MSSSTPHRPGRLGRFLGALLAFIAPGAAIVGAAVLVGSPGDEAITGPEWVTAVVAAVIVAAAVDGQVNRKIRASSRPVDTDTPTSDEIEE